jgi:non-ribosomal peptide synthetase component F
MRPTKFTLAIYAQAAFTLIYSTHAHTSDVLFGMTFSGRDAALPAILSTAGPTLYSVPFRTCINRDQELGAFLDTIRQDILATALHGHIGLPKIRTASEDAERACGFRCIFAVQPRRVEAAEAVFGERLSMTEEMGRLDLIVECFVEDGGVELVVEYNTTSLETGEVERMIEGMEGLLPRLVGLPFETEVGTVPLPGNGREGATF